MKITTLILVFLLAGNLFAQTGNNNSTDPELIRLYRVAEQKLQDQDVRGGRIILQQIIHQDSTFIDAYLLLSDVYGYKGDYMKSMEILNTVIRIADDKYPLVYLSAAMTLIYLGKHEEAKKRLTTFMGFTGITKKTMDIAEYQMKVCNFIIDAKKNPVPYTLKNLGPNVNSKNDDYLPTLTTDEQTLLITVAIENPSHPNDERYNNEDFFSCTMNNGKWTKAKSLSEINTKGNEGAQSISADGSFLVFTACNRPDCLNKSCDLFYSKKIGQTWTKPKNMGNSVNTESWESQPSLSSDGRTLYFASNRKGGIGGRDIWKTTMNNDGNWRKPTVMGDSINTRGSEAAPFIHPDNQSLYFSSDGHLGMGSLDIFISRKNAKGQWGTPKNLGYPINTEKEEPGLIVNAKGDKAYLSAVRDEGYGGLDLYEFDLYGDARPTSVTYIKGKVFESGSNRVVSAKFELIDLESGEIVIQSNSDIKTGMFLVSLPVGKDYCLNVSKKGYLFYSENFALQNNNDNSKPYLFNVKMRPIEIGRKAILKNIFYEINSFALEDKSNVELKKLLEFLIENPTVKIEIGGHTDNIGSKANNQILSENRAKEVYKYLRTNNVKSTRVSFKGYSDTKPIAPNTTEEGRAKNRRTEFKIVK